MRTEGTTSVPEIDFRQICFCPVSVLKH